MHNSSAAFVNDTLDKDLLLSRWSEHDAFSLHGSLLASVILVGSFLLLRRILFPIDRMVFLIFNSSLLWVPSRTYRYLWAALNTHRLGDFAANFVMIGYALYVIVYRETRWMMDEHVAKHTQSNESAKDMSHHYPALLHTIYLYNLARLGFILAFAMAVHRTLSVLHKKLVLPDRVCPSKAMFPNVTSISALLLNEALRTCAPAVTSDPRPVSSPALYEGSDDDEPVSSDWELTGSSPSGKRFVRFLCCRSSNRTK